MANELVSIHGRRLGFSAAGFLTGADNNILSEASFRGLDVGETGRDYFDGTSPRFTSVTFDDFLGAAIHPALWDVNKGSDGAAVSFATLAAQAGGVVQATSGAGAGANMATNGVQLTGGRNYLVSAGPIACEALIKVSALTNINFGVALTDTTVHTLQAPFTISAAVVTANPTNGAALVFDSAGTAVNYTVCAVNAGGTAASSATATAPITTAYVALRVQLDTSGNLYAYIGHASPIASGTLVAGQSYNIASAVATTAILAPKVWMFTQSALSQTINVDWFTCQQAFTGSANVR